MDIFSMLQNATIFDMDGEVRGQTVGFEIINGRMRLKAHMFDDDDLDEDDPDDGEKEDIPEDQIIRHLNVVGDSPTKVAGGDNGL